MIHVAVININSEKGIFEKYNASSFLSEPDYKTYNSLLKPSDRQLMLASRILLDEMAKYIFGRCSIKTLHKNSLGKPILDGIKSVGISHSGEIAAVAMSNVSDIGIDVQHIKHVPLRDIQSVFSRLEQQKFEELPQDARPGWFHAQWSKKEAILKAEGIGLSIDPKRIYADQTRGHIEKGGRSWYFKDCPDIENYSLQLCGDKPSEDVEWYMLKNNELTRLVHLKGRYGQNARAG
ncbi:MAG: 4'-phosphopantetheinyl transferase superfamily protein [Cytophagales bacterium]|nr:4'-phosphopantetheinyl transferase superfamily protein [Cytophagales bacterium]